MLNKDYKEMLQCLLEENVRFLLVGAYAVAVHGFPRATKDIDLVGIHFPSEEKIHRVTANRSGIYWAATTRAAPAIAVPAPRLSSRIDFGFRKNRRARDAANAYPPSTSGKMIVIAAAMSR
jgi:hypothetical protein